MKGLIPKSEFPAIADRIYLNIAGGSVQSIEATNAASRWMGHRPGIEADEFTSPHAVETARWMLARFLQCASDELAIVHNTTDAVNVALAALNLRAGQRLLLPDDEFPGLLAAAEGFRRRGVEIVRIPKLADSDLDWEALTHYVLSGASVLALSWVCYKTGRKYDVRRVTSLCKSRNIAVVVDGMQAVGFVSERLSTLGAQFVAFAWNKGLLGPPGVGVLWVNPEVLAAAPPFACGLGTFSRMGTDAPHAMGARRYEYGNPNHLGIYIARHAVQALLHISSAAVDAHVTGLSRLLIGELKSRSVASPFVDGTDTHSVSNIVSIPEGDAPSIARELRSAGVDVAGFPDRLRISFSVFNEEDDVSRFLDAYLSVKRVNQLRT